MTFWCRQAQFLGEIWNGAGTLSWMCILQTEPSILLLCPLKWLAALNISAFSWLLELPRSWQTLPPAVSLGLGVCFSSKLWKGVQPFIRSAARVNPTLSPSMHIRSRLQYLIYCKITRGLWIYLFLCMCVYVYPCGPCSSFWVVYSDSD